MTEFSLNKDQRLRKKKEISNIIYKGRLQKNGYLKMYYLPNQSGLSRFAVVINRKYGIAVKRNQAKRVVRELFRLNRHKIRSGVDLVFYIINESVSLSYEEKQRLFLELLARLP